LDKKSVAIDCLAVTSRNYGEDTAVVVVDVIRSTTVATTILQSGHRCFFAPTVEAAFLLKRRISNALLVGEVGGNMPYGFDYGNSPIDIESYPKTRPIILVSSSGIPLLYSLRNNGSVYVSCLRNCNATINYLTEKYKHAVLLGAPTRNEFREEDKLCCSWIASGLIDSGFVCVDQKTLDLVNNWKDKPVDVCCQGNSAKYLIETGQETDIEFITKHVNDLDLVSSIRKNEIVKVPKTTRV
jgi:2-phosphosulfolactate phosphatase